MIRFQQEIEIKKPLDTVVRVFRDRTQLPKWQPGLVSSELKEEGPPPVYTQIFQIGRRRMPMVETILIDQLPARYVASYSMKGVVNHVESSFRSTPAGHTLWICDQQFRFKGLMRLVVIFIRSDFEKQSSIIMKNFKGYLESLS